MNYIGRLSRKYLFANTWIMYRKLFEKQKRYKTLQQSVFQTHHDYWSCACHNVVCKDLQGGLVSFNKKTRKSKLRNCF